MSLSPRVLSQWRAYAEDGHGAALGFDARMLCIPDSDSYSMSLVHCVYEDHEGFIQDLENRCEQEIEDLLKMRKEYPAINSFMPALDKNPKPLETLYTELLRVKNPAFVEEQEVRLVISVSTRQAKTRVAEGLIIPYVEHPFMKNYLRDALSIYIPEVWLGPKCNDRNKNALQRFFQQLGWTLNNGIRRYDCGYI
jgi:hypothetical protein